MGNCFGEFEDDESNGKGTGISKPARHRTENNGEDRDKNDYENIQIANRRMDDIDKMWMPTSQNWNRDAWTSQQAIPEPTAARVAPHSPGGVSKIDRFDMDIKREERKFQGVVSKKSPLKSRSPAALTTRRVTTASPTTAAWCCRFEHRREKAHRRAESSGAWLLGTPSTRLTVRGR
ncbi:uncharacterized protein PG986_010744 [Apiospora aurea]|uniref:Uncharacterized protein n=1 Tax=Apiospora aurea TaxID=335848 RepID=A0ABR1Q350_9PEZI